MAYARLTRNTKAVKMLHAKFKDGKLKGNEASKTIWLSDSEFQKYSPDAFRTRFHAIRNEYANETGKVITLLLFQGFGSSIASKSILLTATATIFSNLRRRWYF